MFSIIEKDNVTWVIFTTLYPKVIGKIVFDTCEPHWWHATPIACSRPPSEATSKFFTKDEALEYIKGTA